MGSECKPFNEHQQRRLWATCKHIDQLLGDMEAALGELSSPKAFRKYVPDISAAERAQIEEAMAGIRRQLLGVLEKQGVAIPTPSVPVSRALYTSISFIDIAVEELRPKRMRGYGKLSDSAASELTHIVAELQSSVAKLYKLSEARESSSKAPGKGSTSR